MDLESKMDNNIIYYLDTQIVLEALDLQKAEDTLPTQELLKLIRSTGLKIRLLDITINEIHKIIELAINNYSKSHPTTTVNEACVRIRDQPDAGHDGPHHQRPGSRCCLQAQGQADQAVEGVPGLRRKDQPSGAFPHCAGPRRRLKCELPQAPERRCWQILRCAGG